MLTIFKLALKVPRLLLSQTTTLLLLYHSNSAWMLLQTIRAVSLLSKIRNSELLKDLMLVCGALGGADVGLEDA